MKKYLKLGILPLIAFSSVFYYCHTKTSANRPENTLFLTNVEALAEGEIITSRCYGYGCVDCPLSNVKVKYVVTPFTSGY